jgi:hypothetical protein
MNGARFGCHAFRRDFGTRLNEAGVDEKGFNRYSYTPTY